MRGLVLAARALALTATPAAAATEIDTVPFEAKADDGVVLRGHVYLPKGAPRPLATVLELSPYLPGGNLSVFFWRTKGEGTCPDATATWFARALMDLRHWKVERHSRDFPTGTPTHVRMRSHPFAGVVHKGERIVVAIGGGSSEIEPDARHPLLTVSGGSIALPVAGAPATAAAPAATNRAAPLRFRACSSRRHFTIHL